MILYRSLLWTAVASAAVAFVWQSPTAVVAGAVLAILAFTAKGLS